jgi:hypothetical protein
MANKFSQGRDVTIEAEVDVCIDEYLEYATTECLLEELAERKIDLTGTIKVDSDVITKLICKNLSIVDATHLTIIINKFLNK